METITLGQLLEAVGGTLLGEFQDREALIQRVDTDSRNIHEGALFIPLIGERFDGTPTLMPRWREGQWAVLQPGNERIICLESSMSRFPIPRRPCVIWRHGTREDLISHL